MELRRKLTVLADAAKYDASCASSGSRRKGNDRGLGDTNKIGICHSYTPDGRCVSLLKILLTNYCIYDCQYCVNRVTSDVARARFTPEEVVWLTLEFYRRNYIEGLFLSSGIIRSADYTMDQIRKIVRPTSSDGDSVSVREALTLGVPCVATDVAVRPPGTIVARAGNAADLAEKLEAAFTERPDPTDQPDCALLLMQLYELLWQRGSPHSAEAIEELQPSL